MIFESENNRINLDDYLNMISRHKIVYFDYEFNQSIDKNFILL
jgi:hypothetical protein